MFALLVFFDDLCVYRLSLSLSRFDPIQFSSHLQLSRPSLFAHLYSTDWTHMNPVTMETPRPSWTEEQLRDG